MMRTFAFLAVASAVALLTRPVFAEPLEPGDRVQITAPSQQIEGYGTVEGASGSDLIVKLDGETESRAIPFVTMTTLNVQHGTRGHTGLGAITGLVAGAVCGAMIGAVVLYDAEITWGTTFGTGGGALAGGVAGAVGGAMIGAIAGTAYRTPNWQPVHYRAGEFQISAGPVVAPRSAGVLIQARF